MGRTAALATGAFDLRDLADVEDRVVALERQARALHGARLRAVLDLHRRHTAAGVAPMTSTVWALHTDSGEHAARLLLEEALLLDGLPGALDAVADGLLGVAHCRAVAELLGPLDPGPRVRVWELLLVRLREDVEQSRSRPPARLRELLHRLVRRVDAEGVEARPRAARAAADVTVRHRDDGLADLFACGLTSLDARAVDDRLSRLAALGDPTVEVGRRKADLLVDLLLGRRRYSSADHEVPEQGSACGCLPGDAPCGVEVQVLVPLDLLRGAESDRPAELVGAGLLPEADLRAVLSSAPRLRAVWVDDDGVPVAVGDRTGVVTRGRDPDELDRALRRLLDRPPPRLHPRHPDDHTPDGHGRAGQPFALGIEPDQGWWEQAWRNDSWLDRSPPSSDDPWPDLAPFDPPPDPPAGPSLSEDPVLHDPAYWHALDQQLGLTSSDPDRRSGPARSPQVRQHPHPAGTPGPYTPTADLRRLLHARSPRCEWPGCGTRASRCDLDHDLPWPAGPTCTCNLGPLCRHHHQAKQTGWTKQRHPDGTTTWTSPTGHTCTSGSDD